MRVSIVVVTYESAAALEALLPALARELADGDELIVVDNASTDGSADAARAAGARVIANPANAGFAAACNQGAAAATGDLLVFLNPDSVPEPGFREAIAAPLGGGFDAWMGLVLDGDRINTSGGVVHFTAIAWAGQAGEPAAAAPAQPREVGFLSGACLAIPAATWRSLGGFDPAFFMYHEDVDLSLRLRLRGARLGVAPAARVDHDYAFAKGAAKWRLLERNRWATLLRTYPAPLLAALAPALLALELALWPAALAGGWGRAKALATADVVRALPRLLAQRRAIQATRRVGARAFADGLTAELSSPYLGAAARSPLLRAALRAYWRAVLALLGR
ncbi:MAG: glycosyltransferase family 2 protein [Solirubrobacteraceae bacterium]|nr:glycosyltransferase family 2 protein [Solirubrobacteraceae bacterium]